MVDFQEIFDKYLEIDCAVLSFNPAGFGGFFTNFEMETPFDFIKSSVEVFKLIRYPF